MTDIPFDFSFVQKIVLYFIHINQQTVYYLVSKEQTNIATSKYLCEQCLWNLARSTIGEY